MEFIPVLYTLFFFISESVSFSPLKKVSISLFRLTGGEKYNYTVGKRAYVHGKAASLYYPERRLLFILFCLDYPLFSLPVSGSITGSFPVLPISGPSPVFPASGSVPASPGVSLDTLAKRKAFLIRIRWSSQAVRTK